MINSEYNENSDILNIRFVTGGLDKQLTFYIYIDNKIMEIAKSEVSDPIKDISWSSSLYKTDNIACCTEKEVLIFSKDGDSYKKISDIKIEKDKYPVSLSWSFCGNYLSVCYKDRSVKIYNSTLNKEWEEAAVL